MRPERARVAARAGRVAGQRPGLRAFSQSLPMALLRARESVMRAFRPGLRHHGVTEQQWRVLRALAARPGLELSELAAATCLRPPSLSRILPDLEARGLIERRAVASDMRRAVASPTRAGLDLIARHSPESEAIYREIEARFGPKRLERLHGLLGALEQALAGPLPQPKGNGSRALRRADDAPAGRIGKP
jgi:homoprotocatechuate degradation regulator HpaR